jgi:glycosyltransferase involved in cell wall biosynthesis
MKYNETKNREKRLLWVIDGSLKKKLHKNARIKPACELVKASWKVLMVTSGAPENHKDLPVKFIEISWPKIYLFGALIYYLKLIKMILSGDLKTDILFFQMDSLTAILLFVPFWQKITKRKEYTVVVDYRSLPMDNRSAKGKLRGMVYFSGVVLSRYLDVKITAITSQLFEYLRFRENQLMGIWPSGADLSEFAQCHEKRQWPRDTDPIRLIYLGALTAERNLTSVIHAVRIAKEKGINITLNIIGDGIHKKYLATLAQKEGSGFIKVDGPFPYHMIPDLLAQNDVGLLPFPDVPEMNVSSAIKMFEYMAAGMPILATRIIAHRNVFKEKEFVFWADESPVSIAKAIEAVNRKKMQLPLLGFEAKTYSRNWSWEKSADKLSSALAKEINI